MKIKLLAFALTLAASMGTGYAQSAGLYGFGIELDGTGATATNSGQVTLYGLEYNSDLLPPGSSATLNGSWSSSSPGTAPTFNLGTFTEGVGTLTLTGGAIDSYRSDGGNVTGGTLYYSIAAINANAGPFTAVDLPFNSNLTYNTFPTDPHNQLWDTESQSINVLAGLAPGTYQLAVYGESENNVGNSYANGTGNNYGATFTIVAPATVPEPGTWALMLGGLGMLVCFQRLRRKSAA
jgi:hypothetical protein